MRRNHFPWPSLICSSIAGDGRLVIVCCSDDNSHNRTSMGNRNRPVQVLQEEKRALYRRPAVTEQSAFRCISGEKNNIHCLRCYPTLPASTTDEVERGANNIRRWIEHQRLDSWPCDVADLRSIHLAAKRRSWG